MDKMREEFEAWKKSVEPSANLSKAEGIYISNDTFFDWRAWQASRGALVVDLPFGEHDTFAQDVDALKRRLSDAGISYK